MTTKPADPPHAAACYGIGCPLHAQCHRYAMVEQTSADDTVGTCDWQGDGRWPLFLLAPARMETVPAEATA